MYIMLKKMCSFWQENGGNCSLINHNGVLVINIYVMLYHNNICNNIVLRPGISGVKHTTLAKATRGNLRNLPNSASTERDWLSRVVSSSHAFRYNYYRVKSMNFITPPLAEISISDI